MSFHMTLWFILMYHPTNCGCKRTLQQFSRLYSKNCHNYMKPHCDLDLEGRNAVFLLGTMAHDEPITTSIWVKKIQLFRRYCPDVDKQAFSTFTVTTIQSFTRHSDFIKLFCCKGISFLEDTMNTIFSILWSYFDYMSP